MGRGEKSVDLELRENVKPICLIPYPVPKLHKEMFKIRFSIYFYYESLKEQMTHNLNLNQIE